ncbi:hypothetical protein MRX96_037489 [Rhipicephalus microplus]
MAARSRSWGSDGHWKRLAFKNLSIFRDRGEDEEECGGCVRLSLPDVHMEDAGGGDGPSARLRRSPLVARAKSVDARAMPLLVHRLSISAERRTPSPETLPEPTSPRPRSLSPLLSPAPHAQDPASPIGGIQPDLYRKKEAVFFQSRDVASHSASATLAAPTNAGRLHFRLKYDFDKSDLVVHVIEAMELGGPRMDHQGGAGGFGEPCVRVALLPEVDSKQRQALMRRRSTDPLFDETFKFPVSFDDVPSRTLLFQVFDYDRYSRNDVTGEVRVPLADVDVTTETEVWCDIEKTEKAKRDWPELLLSLSYLPSAGRLTVVILEAANLVPDSDKDKPDTCVKVSLTCGDRKTKKRKTSVKKGSAQPAWNEALSFDVSEEQLSRAQLCVQVCRHGSSGVSCSASLGGFQLGPGGSNVTEEGQCHWKEMLANPRKAASRWHALQPNP